MYHNLRRAGISGGRSVSRHEKTAGIEPAVFNAVTGRRGIQDYDQNMA